VIYYKGIHDIKPSGIWYDKDYEIFKIIILKKNHYLLEKEAHVNHLKRFHLSTICFEIDISFNLHAFIKVKNIMGKK